MDVSKLQGFFNSIVPHIVAGTGYKSSNVQRPSNVEQADIFVGKSRNDVSGKALASASGADIPVQLASRSIANAFQTYAEKQNHTLGLAA